MKAPERIGLFVNSNRDKDFSATVRILDFLNRRAQPAALCGDTAAARRFAGVARAGVSDVDCLLVLGGDGTLLRAAKAAAPAGTPVMGINLGRLGYLTDASADEAIPAIERLLAGEYSLEKRVMLEARIEDGPAFLALNDAFVSRSGPPKLLSFTVEINGDIMGEYQADGILISTPTGSTAYNLSAGGPVIKPDADILAVTPVCPHALHARPAVVSTRDVVSVAIQSAVGGELYMDGDEAAVLESGKRVFINSSKYATVIIKTGNHNFFDILRSKLT